MFTLTFVFTNTHGPRYCMEIPVAALDGSLGSVCLLYGDEFTIVRSDGWTNTTTGCDVFQNDPNYNVCATINTVLGISVGAIIVGVIGDVFSEKVIDLQHHNTPKKPDRLLF
jgi:hypothetical protein